MELRERNRGELYVELVQRRLMRFAAWMEDRGVICLSKVDHQNLRKFLDETLKGRAASYQRCWWTSVKGLLNFHEHPLGTKFHYYATGRDREVHWMTPAQMDFLLSQKLTPREGLMVCAGLYAGLRRCEVLRLTMADLYIAWRTGELSVYGKRKVRSVPIHPDFRLAIQTYLSSVGYGPGERALQICPKHYNAIMRGLGRRTGVPCQSHVLRRSFIRFLNSKRVPMPTIMAISGHSNQETTMAYICAPMDDMKEAVMEIPSRHAQKTVQMTT